MFAILFNGVAFTTKHLSAGIETPEETEKSAKKKFLICRTAVLSQWIVEKFSSTRSFFSCVHRHYRDCCCFYFTWTYAVYKSCFYMLIKNNFFISDIRNGMEHLQRIFHLLLKTKKKNGNIQSDLLIYSKFNGNENVFNTFRNYRRVRSIQIQLGCLCIWRRVYYLLANYCLRLYGREVQL